MKSDNSDLGESRINSLDTVYEGLGAREGATKLACVGKYYSRIHSLLFSIVF